MAEDRAIIPPQGSEYPDILAPPAMEEVKNSISISPPSEDGHDGRMSRMGDGKISDHEGQASPSADFPPTATAVDSTGTSSSLSPADIESASSGSPPPQSETVDAATGPPMPTINEGEALSSSQGRNILSNRSSAAGAAGLGGGAGLGNPKVGLGAGVVPAVEGAGAMAGAVAAGKAESGPGFQKMDHKTTFKHFLASLRIFSYSTLSDRFILAVSVVAAMCSGAAMPCMNIVFGRVFASFTGYYHQNGRTLTNEDFRNLILECVRYLVYLFVARFIFCYVAYLGFRIVSLRISATLRLQYMRAVLSMRVSALDALPPGQTAAVVTMLASTLQQGISERVAIAVQAAALVVAALAVAFSHNWELSLVTCSGVVLIAAVYAATTPLLVRAVNAVQACEVRASAAAAEAFVAVRMVAACGAEHKMARRYDGWVDRGAAEGMRLRPVLALQQAPVFFAIYATFALCFWYALKMYMEGRINTPESMIVVLLCVMMLTGSVSTLTTPIAAAARSANAAAVFYRVIDAPRPKTDGLSGPEAAPLASGDLVLTNVNFAYPTRPLTRVLANLSVRFPAGKTTAIVGPSGSGKSTVVALLERWYEMDGDPVGNIGVLWLRNGIVAAGGKPLKEIDLYWWRSQIGLVQQEPFLFNDSIFQNVAYGLVGTEWEGVGDEEKTKLGYNTPVGDAGIKLSGGQRQRLAIARAIVRRPRILILDEATSAIDPAGERVVQAALENAARGRTTIAIAHRLSTIRRADNIVVVRAGVAVEQGTHEQLMARGDGGVYFGLATAQQLGGGAAVGGDGSVGGGVELADESPEAGGQESADLRLGEEKKEVGERAAEPLEDSGNPGLLRKVKKTTGAEPKIKRGLLGSFGMLLREQMGHWPWYLVMALGALGGGASPALQAWLFANLVTLFQLWGDFARLRAAANFWCLMFVMLATGVGISYFALAWSATRLSFYIIPHYRKEYMRNILLKPISFFDDDANSTGALAARLATDPAQLQQLLGMNMGFVAVSILSVVGCLAISFYFGWKLTAVTVVTTLPLILGAAFFRVRYEKRLEAMGAAVFAESAKFATEGVGAFRTVSSLTLESAICQRYRLLLEKHVREALPRSAASTVLFALSDSIALLCMAFVLWYGGKLMADHEYLPFQYVVVYIAVLQGGMGAGQWLSYAPNIAQATVAANRIVDLRSTKDDDSQLSSLVRGDLGQGDKGVKLEFNNVWFRYPTRDAPVLNGLDLTVEKGQFAAVVGPSGSGKTTVISLLERFYNATTGSISYNGVEISHLCLRDYRREISLVAQEACIFDGSIRENILLGVEEDQMPAKKLEEALIQACCDAEIHDFITSLPEGYESVVGTKGVTLSGGQKQRLAIARALVRNPRLLLLDEATSSLDSETEKAVQAVFEKTKGSRTMIVVAHRLATVQNADVIFVLGEGKVVEKGNHASLLKKKGVYYQMFAPQVGDVDNNLNRADAIISKTHPSQLEHLDLLVLPELAFTGCNFKSLNEISPFLELSGFGISSLWARTTALKHNCHVVVGYPEKVDVEPIWPTSPEYYNSCIMVDGEGETVGNYRKSFLDVDERWALEGRDGFFDEEVDGLGVIAMGICSDINPYKMEAPWASFEFAYHALDSEARLVIVTMSWPTQEDIGQYSCQPSEPDMAMVVYWTERLEPLIRAENDEETIVVFCNRTGTEGDMTYAGSSAVLGIKDGEISIYGILGRGVKELLVVDTDDPPLAKLVDSARSTAFETTESTPSPLEQDFAALAPEPLRLTRTKSPVPSQEPLKDSSSNFLKVPKSSSDPNHAPQKSLPDPKLGAKPVVAPLHTSFSSHQTPAMPRPNSHSSQQNSPDTTNETPQTAKLEAARLTSPVDQRGPSIGMRRSAAAQCLTIDTHVDTMYRKVTKAEPASAPSRSHQPGSALSPAVRLPKSSVLISPPLPSDLSSINSPLLETPTGPSPLPDDLRPKWDFSADSSQYLAGLKPLSPSRFGRTHPTTTGFLTSPRTPETPYPELFEDAPQEDYSGVWRRRGKDSSALEAATDERPGTRSRTGSESYRKISKTPQPFKTRDGDDESRRPTEKFVGDIRHSSSTPRRSKGGGRASPRQELLKSYRNRGSDSTCIPIAASPSVFQTRFEPEDIRIPPKSQRTTPTPMRQKEKGSISVPTSPGAQLPHRVRSPPQQRALRPAPSLPQLTQKRSKSPANLEPPPDLPRRSKSPQGRSTPSHATRPDHGGSEVQKRNGAARARNRSSTACAASGPMIPPQAAETPAQQGSQIARPHTSQGTRGRVSPFPVLPRHARQASQSAAEMPSMERSSRRSRSRGEASRTTRGRSSPRAFGDGAADDDEIVATISKVTRGCPAHSSAARGDTAGVHLAADGQMYSIAFSEGFQSLADVIVPRVRDGRVVVEKKRT
ncbi:hypothetical protein MCOR17_000947 [Pyricularia oryzae]|nr:hypothetical protein MCOR17_000947 [Pyricularia oryzae]